MGEAMEITEARRAYIREYCKKNREKLNARQREYRAKDVEKYRQYRRTYSIQNPEKTKEYRKKTYANNPDYHKNRVIHDVQYRLSKNLRCRLYRALERNFKAGSAVKDLGCSVAEFKDYLESMFKDGMSWDNYGRGGWHIDHIRPLSSFDLTNREEVVIACHYTNMQPLWAAENIRKGAKQ